MIAASDLVVGCVTEDNGKYLDQTLRLLHSIRWFGGTLADARIVVAAVDHLDPRARRAFESLGAEIRIVSRFHPRNGSGNRLQLFEELLDGPQTQLFSIDCDTIVVRDPLPLLRPGVFQAKIEPLPTVTHEVFERLFAHFSLPLPPRSHVTGYTRTKTIPYFNGGVISIPADLARRLLPEWRRFNAALADQPELAAPCARHLHQAALSLALASSGIPVEAADATLNYQINATHLRPPPGYLATDPHIIHYHHLVDREGLLLPCPFPLAQKRIDEFNARLLEERARASGIREFESTPQSKKIVVLGMPRSGTSVVTRLVASMGCYAGEERDLSDADVFHPQGKWEHRALESGGVAAALPDVVKAFPRWREVLDRPICVLVWRDPLGLARSYARHDGVPLVIGLAMWEKETRAMLAASIGLPRVLVSYDQLDAQQLHRDLVAAGAVDLRWACPGPDRQDCLSSAAEVEELLNPWQRELRDTLRSGEVLRWESVPPARPETLELLAEHARGVAAHDRSAALQEQLDAILASRTWRLASTLRKVWRPFR